MEGGEVSGLSYHSAKVQAGDLFFALDGRHREGWRYAREAVASGAVAAVVPERALLEGVPLIRVPDVRLALALIADRFYGHPSRSLRVIGVTGTNGKTTTTHLIDHLFRSRGEKTGLVGTISYRLGASVIPSSATTPEASDLQELMAKLVSPGGRPADHGGLLPCPGTEAGGRVPLCRGGQYQCYQRAPGFSPDL